QRLLVARLAHHHRNVVQARLLRGAPPPFAGDDLEDVGAGERANQKRLHHSLLANRLREVGQIAVVVGSAWILRVRPDERHGQAPLPLGRRLSRSRLNLRLADKCGKPPAQPTASSVFRHSWSLRKKPVAPLLQAALSSRSRWMISAASLR